MRLYRNVFHRPVLDLGPGEEGELELSARNELDYLNQGRLEVVPAEYVVVGPRAVFGHAPAEKFSMALTLGQEANLIAAGHLERVAAKSTRKRSDRGG